MTEFTLDSSVPDWVIEHPGGLAVFHTLDIDHCCGGQSLEFACREHGLDAAAVLKTLLRAIEVNRDDDSDLGKKLGQQLKEPILIVTYQSVLRWVREAEAAHTAKKATPKRKPGRARTPDDIRQFVLRLARENSWGYTRILGELRKMGINSISPQTVKVILNENDIDPGPKRGKGQDYVTTLTDLDGARVLEVVPGRTEADANKAWTTLTESQREGIEAAAIDMSAAYENSVRAKAPHADIVHDRFHVAKLLKESVDQVRRQEQKSLKAEGEERFTGTRQLWLFAAENLDEERTGRLAGLRHGDLRTGRAWAINEYFRWFWKQEDRESGAEQFHDWYSWAIRSRLQPVKRVARTLKERLPNLLTWFAHRITNALSEGFNSVIQNLKANARGFRNSRNYRTRILFFCGQLDLKPAECPAA